MKLERITRDDLRAMRTGESRVYELPTYGAILSARATAYATGRIEGCRFVLSADPEKNVLTITRMPR